MAILGRTQVDAAPDLKHIDVDVPEWGGTVRLAELSSRDRSIIEATTIGVKGQAVQIRIEAFKTLRERVVAAAMVDDQGIRLYKDTELDALGKKSGQVVERLFDIVQDLSGMTPKAAQDAEGNSEGTQTGYSGSDSQSN